MNEPEFVNVFEPIQYILDKLEYFDQVELVDFFMKLYGKDE